MKMQYEPIIPLNKQEAERVFETANPEKIVQALLGATFHETDWEWVETKCLEYLESNVSNLRNAAITCLGHLARIHRTLHKEKVMQALERYLANPECSGRIEDAIDDIEMFVK